jgi:hypothetical protein
MKLQPVYEAAKDTNAPLAELDTNALPVTNCCGTDSPTNSEK